MIEGEEVEDVEFAMQMLGVPLADRRELVRLNKDARTAKRALSPNKKNCCKCYGNLKREGMAAGPCKSCGGYYHKRECIPASTELGKQYCSQDKCRAAYLAEKNAE